MLGIPAAVFRLLIPALALTCAITGQKPAIEDVYIINPIIAVDEGCARDFMKALAAGGLELRKKTVELAAVGCIKKFTGIYSVSAPESGGQRPVTVGKLSMARMQILYDLDLNAIVMHKPPEEALPLSGEIGSMGWVLKSETFHEKRDIIGSRLRK
jgi:hypothetical protein